MTHYEVAMEGIIGTSTVITHLKTLLYTFRIYAFNEYFKGKVGPTADVNLNLPISQFLLALGDNNAKVILHFTYSLITFSILFFLIKLFKNQFSILSLYLLVLIKMIFARNT